MLKNIAKQALSIITDEQSLIVGGLATLVVLGASKIHLVIDKASALAVLSPFITSVLVNLDKKYGVTNTVAGVFKPKAK